jgi:hypothetical protein
MQQIDLHTGDASDPGCPHLSQGSSTQGLLEALQNRNSDLHEGVDDCILAAVEVIEHVLLEVFAD